MLHDPKMATDTQAPIAVRIKDACKMIGISRSKLYELIASGDVETRKIGRITLIPVDALRSLLELSARDG